jgi:hypothetical protein
MARSKSRSKPRSAKSFKATIGTSATIVGVGAATVLAPTAAWASGSHSSGHVAHHGRVTVSSPARVVTDRASGTNSHHWATSTTASGAGASGTGTKTEYAGSVREGQRESSTAQTHEQEGTSQTSTHQSGTQSHEQWTSKTETMSSAGSNDHASAGACVRDAFRSGTPAELQLWNHRGTPTISVSSSSSGSSPRVLVLTPGELHALLNEMLSGSQSQAGATSESRVLIAEIVRAIESGSTVTVSINNGMVTVTTSSSGTGTGSTGQSREDQRESMMAKAHEQEHNTAVTLSSGEVRVLLIQLLRGEHGQQQTTTSNRVLISELIRAIQSGGTVTVNVNRGTSGSTTVQIQVSNGKITVTVPGSSNQVTVTNRAAIEEILEAILGKGSTSESTQLTQILQALESGRSVTITVNHGTVTVSLGAGTSAGATAAPGTVSSSVPGTATATAATIRGSLPSTVAPLGLTSTSGLTAASSQFPAAVSSGFPQAGGSGTGASSSRNSSLAFTGSNAATEAGLAALLAGLGGALAFASKRLFRRPRGSQSQG